MQIQPINYFSSNRKSDNTQFKSVYPVVHWIAESNGSYAPELTKDMAKKLNERIVSMLNANSSEIASEIRNIQEAIKIKNSGVKKVVKKSLNQLTKELNELNLTLRVKSYIARCDKSYSNNSIARGFYNKNGGIKNNSHEAVAYIATSDDVLYFEDLGKQIGRARSAGDFFAEEKARKNYHDKGLEYARKRSNSYRLSTQEPAELHVKLEAVRGNTGKKERYNIVDMRFFPKEGPNNPFMLTDWIKYTS